MRELTVPAESMSIDLLIACPPRALTPQLPDRISAHSPGSSRTKLTAAASHSEGAVIPHLARSFRGRHSTGTEAIGGQAAGFLMVAASTPPRRTKASRNISRPRLLTSRWEGAFLTLSAQKRTSSEAIGPSLKSPRRRQHRRPGLPPRNRPSRATPDMSLTSSIRRS